MSKITDTAARKARSGLRNLKRLGRREFSCACGCGKQWRDYRLMNTHFLAKNGGYWAGKAGKATGRAMGKGTDSVRRHARGTLEAFGHVDRKGERTDLRRSRPVPSGHITLRGMRELHRHARDHTRAGRHDAKAERHRARDFHGPADRRERLAAEARDRWPVLRPRPARTRTR
jgi:hypothetical protein